VVTKHLENIHHVRIKRYILAKEIPSATAVLGGVERRRIQHDKRVLIVIPYTSLHLLKLFAGLIHRMIMVFFDTIFIVIKSGPAGGNSRRNGGIGAGQTPVVCGDKTYSQAG
jgi:hypothetical protein